MKLPREIELEHGSFLSTVFDGDDRRRRPEDGGKARVVEYTLDGVRDFRLPAAPEGEPSYRIITTILDPKAVLAKELAALYLERWEIETWPSTNVSPCNPPAANCRMYNTHAGLA